MNGSYQFQNLGGVIATLALTAEQTGLDIEHLRAGLPDVELIARCQILSREPLIIVDVAHNRQSAAALGEFLQTNRPAKGKGKGTGRTIAVAGILDDKDLTDILPPILPEIDSWFLATLEGERGQSAASLREKIRVVDSKMNGEVNGADESALPDTQCFESPVSAYQQALESASSSDRIVIFGSFFTVGDIIRFIKDQTPHLLS